MDQPFHIEVLTCSFTAGVALGTLPGASYTLALVSSALLCILLLLPFAGKILPLTFLLTGFMCSLTASFGPPAAEPGLLGRLAEECVGKVRAVIDAIPFPSSGTAPLLKAFLTGDRSSLSRETTSVFRASGASHLLALSGLHIGVIYLIFRRVGGVIGNSPAIRALRSLLTVAAAGFFTLMVGASPSIVRAFLFIAISEISVLSGRPRNSLKILCLALFLQLAASPLTIRSVGFQLSYAAMLGIFLIFPVMDSWYPAPEKPAPAVFHPVRRIWQGAALSISCQAFTAPLCWHYFHSFPRYFLLSNLLALPLTTGIITLAIATLASSLLPSGPPSILVFLTDRAVSLLLEILGIIASL